MNDAPALSVTRPRRANLVTEYEGIALDWRVTSECGEVVEIELLTRANLTDAEYNEAEEDAMDEWDNA